MLNFHKYAQYVEGTHKHRRTFGSRILARGMEAVALGFVVLAPWAFNDGAVPALFSGLRARFGTPYFFYFAALGLMLLLAAARILAGSRNSGRICAATLCLALLFVLGAWQLVPWPRPLLAYVSPATSELYGRMLPASPEVLADESPPRAARSEPKPAKPGRTISLDPGHTRQTLYDWLAAAVAFLLVRNAFAGRASLQRLSLVACVNGALLGLAALIAYVRCVAGQGERTGTTPGNLAEFINRNYFAFYLNLCIGLSYGLIVEIVARWRRDKQLPWAPAVARQHAAAQPKPISNFIAVLLAAGLLAALMVTALILTQSRGGLVALVGAAALCLIVSRVQARRWHGVEAVVLIAGLALGLTSWMGMSWAKSHYASLTTEQGREDGRLVTWSNAWPLVLKFPLWGTGYGSFARVEPLHRTKPEEPGRFEPHALNEYLEALVEGGVLRLLLTLLLAGTVAYQGFRAYGLRRHHAGGGLVLGALFAFLTASIHSVFESGIHSSATATLVIVIAAELGAMSERGRSKRRSSSHASRTSPTWRVGTSGRKRFAWAGVLCGLAALVFAKGWQDHRVMPLWGRSVSTLPTPVFSPQRLAAMEQAVRGAPENASMHVDLAWMHEALCEIQMYRLHDSVQALQAAEAWSSLAAGMLAPSRSGLPAAAALSSTASWEQASVMRAKRETLKTRHLLPALRAYLRARDLCPLLGRAQMGIAAHTDLLARGDPSDSYLARAKFIHPTDTEMWFRCGHLEQLRRADDATWASWRRALELSGRHLRAIMDEARKVLTVRDLTEKVLPDQPALLLAAARVVDPNLKAAAEPRPILEKALRCLDEAPATASADWWRYRALTLGYLGDGAAARSAYQEALRRKPLEVEWSFEYATLLYELGHLDEAAEQLRLVLTFQPHHNGARQLTAEVSQRLADRLRIASLFRETRRDFGSVPRGTTLEHQFHWTNTSRHALRIAQIRTSSDCMTASSDRQEWPPGSSGTITVRLDTAKFTGMKSLMVHLDFDRPKVQEVQLTLLAGVREEVAGRQPVWIVEPAEVDIGPVTGGKAATAQVVVRCDAPFSIRSIDGSDDLIGVEFDPARTSGVHHLTVKVSAKNLTGSVSRRIRIHAGGSADGVAEFLCRVTFSE